MPRKIIKSKFELYDEQYEKISEVPAEEYKPWPKNEELKYVGKPIPRIDGYEKVSGGALYTMDREFKRLCHAVTLRSPHPHAKIKKIDTSKAKKLKGVLDIIHYNNTPEIPFYRMSFLFDPHLRYQGDEVACIAAEDLNTAKEAAKLIEVEYEVMDFVIEIDEAMKDNAVKLHSDGNVVGNQAYTYKRGEPDKYLDTDNAGDDILIEDTFTTQVEIHNPAEPHSSVVDFSDDKLTVYDSTQNVFGVREQVANALNMNLNDVRIIKKFMGGGFGSKLMASKHTVMAALVSKRINRPVKIYLDRREMNQAVGNRPNSIQTYKARVKKDGTLVAMSLHHKGTPGAFSGSTNPSTPFRQIYKCDNLYTEAYHVMTNAGYQRPFRAPGHVQGTFALESFIDELAEKVDMNPLDFRIKNYSETDPWLNMPYTTKMLMEAYKQGAEAFGWYDKWRKPGSDTGSKKRGVGLATQIWWGGGTTPAYATLKVNRDGTARILSGTQDIGGGTYTILAQTAAEVLEIPIDKIEVTLGDTETCPFGVVSGGSLTAPSETPAVRDAAEQMKSKLIESAAAVFETDISNIVYSEGTLSMKEGDKKMSTGELIREIGEQVLVTTGNRGPTNEDLAECTFGVHFAEVEVDSLTGKVTVLKVLAAHDIGRVVNRMTMENQMHGGIIQGLGYALMEERIIDKNTGKLITTNLHDYKMATMMDSPEIEVLVVSDGDEKLNNTGVKGCGEPATIPTSGAIANAVYNALGVRIKSLPITPDKVLNAIKNKV